MEKRKYDGEAEIRLRKKALEREGTQTKRSTYKEQARNPYRDGGRKLSGSRTV